MPQYKRKTAMAVAAGVLLALGTAMALVTHERAAHWERVQGAWEGALHFHAGARMRTQRIVLRVLKDHGSFQAFVDEIDIGLKNLPASKFNAHGTSVGFALGSGFSYQGKLDGAATEIAGRWKWPGDKFSQPLTLTRTLTPDAVPEPLAQADYTPRPGSDLQGLWKGTLNVGSLSLRLRLKITEPSKGTFRAELNSIDQPPVIPLPATTVDYDKPHVRMSFQGIGALFNAELDESGTTLAGTWAQARTSPLTLVRADPEDEVQAETTKTPP
jgi:hypothetical protein